jgi:exodeoxyribonuclease VII large subunit
MAHDSSPEAPLPVRTVAQAIAGWVDRLGRVWMEGQLTEVSRRPGASLVFLTLRDVAAEVSLRLTCHRSVFDRLQPAPAEGTRVIVWAKPEFYLARGNLSLSVSEIRPVGIGELLARIERLKQDLAAEGLFAAERKRPLPFLPRCVGLVTGRGSAAEHDVVENATRRWPAVEFAVRTVPVQGAQAASAVVGALRDLDADPRVDVIVLARGGGSVEDLLPFSDEGVVRAIEGCATPVISAVGHETDAPLSDLVADRRASTPTDAGKLVVPDVAEEIARIDALRRRAFRCVGGLLAREQERMAALRSRPAVAAPIALIDRRSTEVSALQQRATRCAAGRLQAAETDLTHTLARVRALSPAATMRRGYAVLLRADGRAVRSARDVIHGDPLEARVADGRFAVTVSADG